MKIVRRSKMIEYQKEQLPTAQVVGISAIFDVFVILLGDENCVAYYQYSTENQGKKDRSIQKDLLRLILIGRHD